MMIESMVSKMFVTAREAALEAGRILVSRLRTDFQISKKGRINLVTEMDLQVEEMIVDRIRADFPKHKILAEERGNEAGSGPFKWVIDPLDGTTNYAHGYRFFSVSVAVEFEGQIILGVVYDPVVDELFSARIGKGAYLNDKPIYVSAEEQLVDSFLCTGFSYDRKEILRNLRFFERLILKCRAIRRDGSAALDMCYVASGRFDGFWEVSLNPWDVAAGKLIVEEAGGTVSRLDGSGCTIYDREIVATNGRIDGVLVEQLTQ